MDKTQSIISSSFGVLSPKLWSTFTYAPEWFDDALLETKLEGHKARRREILFAVCAAESYIFEWVRDTVLKRNFTALEKYFPPGLKRGVTEKLRDIPKQLATDGRIAAPIDCSGHAWQAFERLVKFRDGLTHASASRPSTAGLNVEKNPIPSKTELDKMSAGWALSVVRALLQKLHSDTKTPQPQWLN